MTIGERLKKLRGKSTQGEFAASIGCHKNTVQRYEAGERSPDAEYILMVCNATATDPAWLITGRIIYDKEMLIKVSNVVGRVAKKYDLGDRIGKLLVSSYERVRGEDVNEYEIVNIVSEYLDLMGVQQDSEKAGVTQVSIGGKNIKQAGRDITNG